MYNRPLKQNVLNVESTKYRQRIRLKDKRMTKESVLGCGGAPEELPLNCAFRLCHRLESLKQTLK